MRSGAYTAVLRHFLGGRLNLRQVAGLLLSCAGVLIIIFRGDPRGLLALAFSSGDLLLLAAMTCFAFYTLWLRGLPADINRLGLLGVQVMITLVAVFFCSAVGARHG